MASFEKYLTIFGQAYGTDSYGAEIYSCEQTDTVCIEQAQSGAAAPNTGFFGSSDAALATTGGALLVAIAIAGAIFVIVSRVKRNKSKQQ